MSYRVEYGKPSQRYGQRGRGWGRIAALAACFTVLTGYLTIRFWPEGAEVMYRLISVDNWEVTRQALETMAAELRAGLSLGEAVAAFCREVVAEGLSYGQ